MNSDQLLEKIANSNPIDFGTILGKSIELFKKVWLQGFFHLLISMVIVIPLLMITYIPIVVMIGVDGYREAYSNTYEFEEVSIGLSILIAIVVLVVSILGSALQFGIMAHFYRVCKQVDLGEVETTNYFMFFRGKYLQKIMVMAMAIFGITLLAFVFCFFPLVYVIVPIYILGVFFAFNPEISELDLIVASFKFGNKIWLTGFLLIIISSLLAQSLGFVLCFIGVFFTMSFVYIPIYYMYKEAIGFEDEIESKKDTLTV